MGVKNPERLAYRMLVWAWVETASGNSHRYGRTSDPKPCFLSLDSILGRFYLADSRRRPKVRHSLKSRIGLAAAALIAVAAACGSEPTPAPAPAPQPPPPTATAIPPTATALPPTQTPPPPTATAEPTVTATAVAVVEQTVTLTSIKDNTIYEPLIGVFVLNSNGRGSHIFAGNNNGGFARRALIAFDVDEQIPANAIIVDAILRLHLSRTISLEQTIEVHRLLRNWGEGASDGSTVNLQEGQGAPTQQGDATWMHRVFDTEMWEVPGGDFSDAASAGESVGDVGDYAWNSKRLTADVQMWVDDPSSNFGWIVIGNESINKTAKRFDSRENATAANRPSLQVTFAVPEGSASSGGAEPSPTPYVDLGF